MRKIITPLFAVCLLVTCFITCRKESKGPSWDVDVLAPLVKSTLTINNLITNSLLHKNPDNSLDLVYNYALSAFSVDSLFRIPDTTLKNKYTWIFSSIALPPGGTIVPLQLQNVQSVNIDQQLTRVTIRSGYMLLLIKSSITEKTLVTYTLPKVTDAAGNTFSITAPVPKATASVNGIYNQPIDLSGYNVDLRGTNGISVNTMVISYSAIVDPSASDSAHIKTLDSVVISNTFKDIVPQYAKGYFGQTVTNPKPDTADFSLFKHITDGTLKLEDIDIGLSIENSIGVDARVTIHDLSSINTRTNTTKHLIANSIIGTPLNINRGADNSGIVTPSTYSISLTPLNSNIKDFIENLPDKLSFQLGMEINPLGNVSGNNDFIYYDKLMKTELNMTIPLSIIANDFTMADTMDYKLNTQANNVNSGQLKLYVDNGFPFTAQAQLYLMDDNLAIIDSLIDSPNVIQAPALDAYFICAGKKQTILSIPVSAGKMNLLRETKKMYLKMKCNTAGQPSYVKLYSFYEMNVKLVANFNYTVGKK
jgi:hypothetical protein